MPACAPAAAGSTRIEVTAATTLPPAESRRPASQHGRETAGRSLATPTLSRMGVTGTASPTGSTRSAGRAAPPGTVSAGPGAAPALPGAGVGDGAEGTAWAWGPAGLAGRLSGCGVVGAQLAEIRRAH